MFDPFVFWCFSQVFSLLTKLAKVPNERPRLAVHFKLNNASQLALTVEKNVPKIGSKIIEKKTNLTLVLRSINFVFLA